MISFTFGSTVVAIDNNELTFGNKVLAFCNNVLAQLAFCSSSHFRAPSIYRFEKGKAARIAQNAPNLREKRASSRRERRKMRIFADGKSLRTWDVSESMNLRNQRIRNMKLKREYYLLKLTSVRDTNWYILNDAKS